MLCAARVTSFLFPACTMQKDGFDSETWKAQRGVNAVDNKRINMVTSLEATLQIGMPKTEVICLLGEPDSHDTETDTDVYFIGIAWSPSEQFYKVRYKKGVVSSFQWGRY